MPNNGREGKVAGRTLVVIVAVFLLAFAFLVWGDSGTHIASNPGPSGMPESTIINPAPPPANGPSGTTTGTAH
jgi:hypothetical protein